MIFILRMTLAGKLFLLSLLVSFSSSTITIVNPKGLQDKFSIPFLIIDKKYNNSYFCRKYWILPCQFWEYSIWPNFLWNISILWSWEWMLTYWRKIICTFIFYSWTWLKCSLDSKRWRKWAIRWFKSCLERFIQLSNLLNTERRMLFCYQKQKCRRCKWKSSYNLQQLRKAGCRWYHFDGLIRSQRKRSYGVNCLYYKRYWRSAH